LRLVVSGEKKKEFERAARPLIRFLRRNYTPRVTVYVDCFQAVLMEGICAAGGLEREKNEDKRQKNSAMGGRIRRGMP
jgi:hypothetical protein